MQETVKTPEQILTFAGSFVHHLKFKVDSPISFEGTEICISKAPTEIILRLSECKRLYQRPLLCTERVYKAEKDRATNSQRHRYVHFSFPNPVLIKPNRFYMIHATLKSSELYPQMENYRNQLSFDGVCLTLLRNDSADFESAVFTALTFKSLSSDVRRKIPITI